MKRFIFILLILTCIGLSSYFVLCAKFNIADATAGGGTLYAHLEAVLKSVKAGSWSWSDFGGTAVFTYGLVAFLFINAVLLVSILVMALTTLFKFSKIYRFFATMWWYLFAALVFTAALGFLMLDIGGDLMDLVKAMPWELAVPLGSALMLVIIGSIFSFIERRE